MRIRAIEDAVGVMLQSGRVTKDVGSNPGTVAALLYCALTRSRALLIWAGSISILISLRVGETSVSSVFMFCVSYLS